MTRTIPTHFYLLHKGGPSLLDLKVGSNDAHVLVTGPGMLFSKLRLLTSLSIFEGCDIHRLREFAQSIDGRLAPLGHRIDDEMWPWVGNVQGYDTEGVVPDVKSMLPDFSQVESVTVQDVLDVEAMGYHYTPPANGSN